MPVSETKNISKIIECLQSITDHGFGELIIKIQNGHIVHIERRYSDKV